MNKFFAVVAFLLLSYNFSTGAEISYSVDNERLNISAKFEKGYSNYDILKSNNSIILTFDTAEKVNFKNEDFFDLPVTSLTLNSQDGKNKLIIKFEKDVIEPKVVRNEKDLILTFLFPASYVTAQAETANQIANQQTPSAVPTSTAYFKMLFGLIVILCIILVIYYVLKTYFKKQIFTDIPGTGRLLGKIDLDMRKSLYFYDLVDNIYIIGITDNNMTLIDKVNDEIEATKIRSGFVKKKDFGGYMNFFRKKAELDQEMSTSNAIVEEKLRSLRKK